MPACCIIDRKPRFSQSRDLILDYPNSTVYMLLLHGYYGCYEWQ